MNQVPEDPSDRPVPGNDNRDNITDDRPRRRTGAALWLLLLLLLLLLGWWWFSQHKSTADGELPPPTAGEPATAATTAAEEAAAEARRKAAETREKPRTPRKPAAPRLTEASPIAGYDQQPDYPRDAQRRGLSGRVVLRVEVAADGSAGDVAFVQRSGAPELDRAAMNAVRKWRFAPARRDGKPVASSVNVPIDFVLPER